MVTAAIDACLRDHLLAKPNLFIDKNFNPSVASFQRPVLYLFDRNFNLFMGIQTRLQRRRRSHGKAGREPYRSIETIVFLRTGGDKARRAGVSWIR